jgi:hypothetical protein
MKSFVPLAATCFITAPYLRRLMMPLVAAVTLAAANQAQALNVYYVTWNPTNAWQNITDTIAAAAAQGGPSRIILENHGAPWYIDKMVELNQPNMEIWIKGGATVEATVGGFTLNQPMFKITGASVTMRGYANFNDATGGVATLKMRKNDYFSYAGAKGSRHCISVRGNHSIVKGFNLIDSGGDGIAVTKEVAGVPPYNAVLKDLVCDNNSRQGISVISVDKLTVSDCVFKNTSGLPPGAGLDIEPSIPSDVLKAITFTNCVFYNNEGNNVEINLSKLPNSGPPIEITLDGCTINTGTKNGIGFYALHPTDGPTGTIVIKNTEIKNMFLSGVNFGGWGSADRVSTAFTNVYFTNCAQSGSIPPIYFSQASSPAHQTGEVAFTGGCHVHDGPTTIRSSAILGSTSNVQAAQPKDITGAITVHRHPDSTGPMVNLGPNPINCTVNVYVIP